MKYRAHKSLNGDAIVPIYFNLYNCRCSKYIEYLFNVYIQKYFSHIHCTCMVSSLKGTTDIHAHINCTLYLSDVNLLFYFIVPSGLLGAPYDFSLSMSSSSNTTFLLSWGAPFSLDVTDSPDIFYYTLCTNITIYGCKNISSDPDCTFPRTCTSSVDFTHPSLNGTNGGQNKAIDGDYGDPIYFTFFAVNGAGNGENNTYHFNPQKQGLF